MTINKKPVFFVGFFLVFFLLATFFSVLLVPVVIALVLFYIFDPLLTYLEKHKIKRSISAAAILGFLVLGVCFLVWIFFPVLYNQMAGLKKMYPDFRFYLEHVLFPKAQKIIGDFTGLRYQRLVKIYDLVPIDVSKYAETIILKIGYSTRFIGTGLLWIFTAPFFLYLFLKDGEKIYRYVVNLVPIHLQPTFIDVSQAIDKKLQAVILGQLTMIPVFCTLYTTFLFLGGLPSAVVVGTLIGVARFVPFFDFIVGCSLCFFVLVTHAADNALIFSVTLSFLAVQALDAFLITPRLMGKFSGLPPVLIFLSIISFSNWLGVYGVLFAVPLAAVLQVGVKKLLVCYKRSDYYRKSMG